MKGKRADIVTGKLKPGDYSHHNEDGGLHQKDWYAMTPNGILTHLGGHEIEQHSDGTITVFEPNEDETAPRKLALIQATMEDKSWRGLLERGEWREAKDER